MKTTFVILAAGKGSRVGRVGENLHKALLPLNKRAVLSHLFDLAPMDSKIIIVIGDKAGQIKEYCNLAHPQKNIQFIEKRGGGPGAALLATKFYIEGDMIFTSCDTLWSKDCTLWNSNYSWAATAPIPSGTAINRWCRFSLINEKIEHIFDKSIGPIGVVYTGLAMIKKIDLIEFWLGLSNAKLIQGELQVSGGFEQLIKKHALYNRRIYWTDVGDEKSYRLAVAKSSGYDWIKLGQATYVLPIEGRVVKFFADSNIVQKRAKRATLIPNIVPNSIESCNTMLSYNYIPGITGYEAVEKYGEKFVNTVIHWVKKFKRKKYCSNKSFLTYHFYNLKTYQRIEMLTPNLKDLATDIVSKIDWEWLSKGFQAGFLHGDLNFGNIIFSNKKRIYGIDWREDFAGCIWGDLRYDYAKLIAGCVTHWDRAQNGDFRLWEDGLKYKQIFIEAFGGKDIETIAALSFINSAPLHAPPLDEILIARGVAWLENLKE